MINRLFVSPGFFFLFCLPMHFDSSHTHVSIKCIREATKSCSIFKMVLLNENGKYLKQFPCIQRHKIYTWTFEMAGANIIEFQFSQKQWRTIDLLKCIVCMHVYFVNYLNEPIDCVHVCVCVGTNSRTDLRSSELEKLENTQTMDCICTV